MPFAISDFCARRPFLYHLTANTNLSRIRRTGVILSAGKILTEAGRDDLIRTRRATSVEVRLGAESVHIRDQSPLHLGNMRLQAGWSFDDFVSHLNDHAFFWPGSSAGPSAYGMRHFERYRDDNVRMIRVSSDAFFAANKGAAPLFCKYNSGSPRCSNGQPSPRTAATFISADASPFGIGSVVEVTFLHRAVLPEGAQSSGAPAGPWRRLI
jgi:hypothetical protein